MDDTELHTIKRRFDEPKLEVGSTVVVEDGGTGVVIARYTPSAHRDESRYVVVVVPSQKHRKRPG